MWVWLYGLAISLFLVLQELGVNNLVSLIPLIVLSLSALGEFIYMVIKNPNEWRKWLNTGFLFTLSLLLVVLVSLQIENIIKFGTFFATLTAMVTIVSLIYVILRGQYTVFKLSPTHLRIANIVSFVASVTTYLCFYGVEYDSIARWVPIVPFAISVLVEVYIVYTLYNGWGGINESFSEKWAMDRMVYMSCILILFLCAIIHYLAVTDDLFLYGAASIGYFLGIVVITIRSRKQICNISKCCKRAPYQELKTDDINPEDGVTNG